MTYKTSENNPRPAVEAKRFNIWPLFLVWLVTIAIGGAISYLLVQNLAAPKEIYTSELSRIFIDLQHLDSAVSGLNSHTGFQDEATQAVLENLESKILGINNALITNTTDHTSILQKFTSLQANLSLLSEEQSDQSDSIGEVDGRVDDLADTTTAGIAALNTKIATLTTADTTINTKVNGLDAQITDIKATINGVAGLQIIPTITANGNTGSINLSIRSDQSVASQVIAFNIEFRPKMDVRQNASYETLFKDLYNLPLVMLTPGGAGGVVIGADRITYDIYYSSGVYHLGGINFKTRGTAIVDGVQTRTISYVIVPSLAAYDVVITPQFETPTDSSGASILTW